jgi:hypothetical protein
MLSTVPKDAASGPFSPARPYVYILVREDLDPVTRIVQASHAALEAGFVFGKPDSSEPVHLVTLGVSDRHELERHARRLESLGIDAVMFFEPDHGIGYSALASRPVFGDERRAFRGMSLLRHFEQSALG